jgi:hypothetical protein
MVYNPDLTAEKEVITGILVADLTPSQLDFVQEKFGIGANMCSPIPSEQLFIHDKRSWSSHSHADMLRAMPDLVGLIVIDSRSAEDGSAWYLDSFADSEEVADGNAENTNTLFKLRMKLEDVVISYTNYKIANTSIREDMDQVDVPYPTPESFDQEEAFSTGFNYVDERYMNPTWVTATPDELETPTGYRVPFETGRGEEGWIKGALDVWCRCGRSRVAGRNGAQVSERKQSTAV